jgi:hypothetical protein
VINDPNYHTVGMNAAKTMLQRRFAAFFTLIALRSLQTLAIHS